MNYYDSDQLFNSLNINVFHDPSRVNRRFITYGKSLKREQNTSCIHLDECLIKQSPSINFDISIEVLLKNNNKDIKCYCLKK